MTELVLDSLAEIAVTASPPERAVSFHTLGCKTNQLETSALANAFRARGWRVTSFDEPASVAVINTCTVTERADADSRRAIRRARLANPEARIVVTGCYAQVAPQAVSQLPGVDYVIGNNLKDRLLDILETVPRGDTPVTQVGDIDKSRMMAGAAACDVDRTRASLKIQDGCDFKCAYCIIWEARGKSRSLSVADILAQLQELEAFGYREVVLTGINIGQYEDLDAGLDLVGLLSRLVEAAGSARLRLTSLDPVEVSDGLIETIARSNGRICPHLHLSAQSLCDDVLKAMGRRHRASDVIVACQTIASQLPDAGLGADIIVGFPGETEAMFAQTAALIESLPWTYLHVFRYSRRPGTPAADWGDQLPESVKTARAEHLRSIIDAKNRRFRHRLIGKTFPALIEESGRCGMTDRYVKISLTPQTPAHEPNALISARVESVEDDITWATPVMLY
ncbi:MAG: tRNA (N(6)-L-threonylcarbamoyladenosine(37)-C(2))-methylthiotransferase MtaB [Vampirovibrionales bacterium]|nr:tRNA (N(6)-L-threonylcarbamoyladenosine(37)-C(2))-methylthiotransferase MtaB [Vampirovibrionales bacterium]